jgi:hypothetical protein
MPTTTAQSPEETAEKIVSHLEESGLLDNLNDIKSLQVSFKDISSALNANFKKGEMIVLNATSDGKNTVMSSFKSFCAKGLDRYKEISTLAAIAGMGLIQMGAVNNEQAVAILGVSLVTYIFGGNLRENILKGAGIGVSDLGDLGGVYDKIKISISDESMPHQATGPIKDAILKILAKSESDRLGYLTAKEKARAEYLIESIPRQANGEPYDNDEYHDTPLSTKDETQPVKVVVSDPVTPVNKVPYTFAPQPLTREEKVELERYLTEQRKNTDIKTQSSNGTKDPALAMA